MINTNNFFQEYEELGNKFDQISKKSLSDFLELKNHLAKIDKIPPLREGIHIFKRLSKAYGDMANICHEMEIDCLDLKRIYQEYLDLFAKYGITDIKEIIK